MPHDPQTLSTLLRNLDRAFRNWRSTYFDRDSFSLKRDPVGLLRYCRNPDAEPRRATFLAAYKSTEKQLSNHAQLAKHAAEAEIIEVLKTLADALAAAPLLDHEDLCVEVTMHSSGASPKLELTVDGLDAHSSPVLLPTLLKRLQPKLSMLEKLPGRGAFHSFFIQERNVHAPSPDLALAKWACFMHPLLFGSNLDFAYLPDVMLKASKSELRTGLKALVQEVEA